MMKLSSHLILPVIGVLILGGGILGIMFRSESQQSNINPVSSFEECVVAGNPVMESYPEQCRTSDGKIFIKQIAPVAGPITVRGEFVCLPHKNTEGGTTMECAFGLRHGGDRYYSLRDTDPEYKNTSSATVGDLIEVSGIFTPKSDSIYQDIGIIDVESLTVLVKIPR